MSRVGESERRYRLLEVNVRILELEVDTLKLKNVPPPIKPQDVEPGDF